MQTHKESFSGDSNKDDFPPPTGLCEVCGQPFWQEHDHRIYGTLTAEEAAEYWSPQAVAQRAQHS